MSDEERRSIERALGEHTGQIEALRQDTMQIKKDVRCILNTISEARGGWRALLLVASIAGTIGAVLATIASWFTWTPR